MSLRESIKNLFISPAAKEKKRKLLTESNVFCMAPWLQLHAQTNGKVAPCCMSAVYSNNELGDLRVNPNLEEAWNSENAKQLRLNMLQGKTNTICSLCYKYEGVGKVSERMMYNRDYKQWYSKVEATLPDGSLKGFEVPLVDIRFSNKCNYKCRICDSEFSSLWYDEEQKIDKKPKLPSEKEMYVASDKVTFWDSYKRLLPGVKRLHFAGGEPLFMDEHYETLEYLISVGRTNVTLSYNTNFSTLRYKRYNVIDLWNKFERVDIWASLDMMGEKGDYQRKGQKWNKIEENIRLVQRECATAQFGVNVTANILNVLYIPEFFQYMVDNRLVEPHRMNVYLLFEPPYYNLTNLTPALKQKVLRRYENFERNYLDNIANADNFRNHIRAATAYMMSEDGTLKNEFRHWIKAVDELRGEHFVSVFPELAEMMNESEVNTLL